MTVPTAGMPVLYDADKVDTVPSEPGIYAWYAVPIAGPKDWQVDLDASGHDRGGQNYASFLASHTNRLQHPTLRLDVKWHLWAAWNGELQDEGTSRLAQHIHDLPNASGASDLEWTLGHGPAREVLAQVLVETAPRLTAPIYIGVASVLSERLPQHIKDLAKAGALLSAGKDVPKKLAGKFGGRAAMSGLRIADLKVAVLPLPGLGSKLSDADNRRVSEAAEFVLNRWHHPILGVK